MRGLRLSLLLLLQLLLLMFLMLPLWTPVVEALLLGSLLFKHLLLGCLWQGNPLMMSRPLWTPLLSSLLLRHLNFVDRLACNPLERTLLGGNLLVVRDLMWRPLLLGNLLVRLLLLMPLLSRHLL